ncbi:hypothetical protein MCHI_001860 [Candidatus Magnetoovum chiemensis]|nr:hypothetical protein MCHI_001860 [Candidatus Magnetoovum chiemensis]
MTNLKEVEMLKRIVLFVIMFFIITLSIIGFAYISPMLPSLELYNKALDLGLDDKEIELSAIAVAGFAGSLLLSIILSILMRERFKKAEIKSDAPSIIIEEPETEAAHHKEEELKPPPKLPYEEKAVQILSILQKKGRFIDFIHEDLSAYSDQQIGQAVRNIHQGCKDAIVEYIHIEPVMEQKEGQEVVIQEGFDPSAVALTGNVSGNPPFTGTLRHCGWKVTATELPQLSQSRDKSIIEPAEIEIT